jgi:hypothetical protein
LIIIRLFVVCFRDINYDAYNKPKSILYGNGSLTRNIYSPHNNNLTSIEIGRGGDLINNMSYRYVNSAGELVGGVVCHVACACFKG